MIDKISFLNAAWSLPILLGAALLLAVFIWKESREFATFRVYMKVLVGFFAIASLVIIALKPALLNYEKSGNLIILTPNFRENSLDSLKKIHEKIEVISYDPEIPIITEIEKSDSIFILGYGIKIYDSWQLEGKNKKIIQGKPLSGITKFKYSEKQMLGEKALFKGLYLNPKKGTKLFLEGPGSKYLDSIILNNNKKQSFTLSVYLKSAGNFIYNLVEKDSLGNSISTNPIPIIIEDKEPLKILVINSFPTFETKYLKNFLAESGHEVIVRNQVTKGKFKYEYFNTEITELGSISEKMLEEYDLLITDFPSFKSFSASEKNVVESAIKESGLGLFIQPDPALFKMNTGLLSFDFKGDNNEKALLQEKVSLKKYPFDFQKNIALQAIQKSGNKMLSASKRIGQGKIGTSVLENTYELLLDGNESAYKELWTQIINSISKREILVTEWSSKEKTAFPGEPFEFQIRSEDLNPVVITDEDAIIPLRRDIDISNLWTGFTYPKTTGWHQMRVKQDSINVFDYYVATSEDWKTLQTHQQILFNSQIKEHSGSVKKRTSKPVPINPIYFYFLFLICMGYLWLEPKMRSY